MIEAALNRLGYYKFTMPSGATVSEAEILDLMGTYGDNEIFTRFLRDLCAQDIRLYFNATSDRDRFVVRGAHDRSLYFLSLVHKAHAKRKRKK